VTPVASMTHVSKRFGRHTALTDVTAMLFAAELVGLVGPNGAGKTTALRVAAGLILPTAGEVSGPPAHAIAYFGGEQTLPADVSARRWAELWNGPWSRLAPRRSFGVLSRGTRQRIGLETALSSPSTELLLLDEPWESLDPDASRWLSDQLIRRRAGGAAVLVSSHRMHELASICDRCLFLSNGRITASVVCPADVSPDERVASLLDAYDRSRANSAETSGGHR